MENTVIYEDKYSITEYANGTLFVARKIPDAPKFSVAALMQSGAYDDSVPGAAHFFEHLPFARTAHFKDSEIFGYMSQRGGYAAAYTGLEWTHYFGEVRRGFEKDAILAVSDLVCRPAFDQKCFDEEKHTILDEWAYGQMNEDCINYMRASEAAFGNNAPVPIIGTEQTIRSIGLPDIESHFQRNYFSDRLIVAMEGDFNAREMLDFAKEHFQLPRGLIQNSWQILPFQSQTRFIETPHNATKVGIVFPARPQTVSLNERLSAYILRQVLFDVTGPVFRDARLKKRLVYSVGVTISGHQTNYGFDTVVFDAHPEKVPAAIESVATSITGFLQNPDEKTFREAVDNHILAWRENLKKDPKVGAKTIAENIQNTGTVDSRPMYISLLENLTLDDVVRIGEKYLTGGNVSVMYIGQNRPDFPDHKYVSGLLGSSPERSPSTDANLSATTKFSDKPKI